MGQGARPPVTRKLPYLKSYRDRHGNERHYFRRVGWPTIPLPGEHGSREFMDAYWAIREGRHTSEERGIELETPGSVSALIARYYKTAAFKKLAPKTRATYQPPPLRSSGRNAPRQRMRSAPALTGVTLCTSTRIGRPDPAT